MRFAPATSVEMRTPAVASAVMHALVIVVAILGLPDFFFPPPVVEPEPVMVEFEAIAKKAAAPIAGNPPPQPKEAKVDKEATKAPPPKTRRPAARAADAQAARTRGAATSAHAGGEAQA